VGAGRGGRRGPPGHAAALAGAIAGLLDDPEAAEGLGRAARREVEERFAWRRTAERLLATYAEVLAERGGGDAGPALAVAEEAGPPPAPAAADVAPRAAPEAPREAVR
jgi:hypothetical protein